VDLAQAAVSLGLADINGLDVWVCTRCDNTGVMGPTEGRVALGALSQTSGGAHICSIPCCRTRVRMDRELARRCGILGALMPAPRWATGGEMRQSTAVIRRRSRA